MSEARRTAGIAPARTHELVELVDYADGAIVSRTLQKTSGAVMTVFAFDRDQELSEHSAPFEAFVHVIHGRVLLTVGGAPVEAKVGDIVLMPANVPHAVRAIEPFKMLLVMIKT